VRSVDARQDRSCYGCRPYASREEPAPALMQAGDLPISAAVHLGQAQVMFDSSPLQEPVEQVNNEGNWFRRPTPRRCRPHGKTKMVVDTSG
jgi:hypothetical protein